MFTARVSIFKTIGEEKKNNRLRSREKIRVVGT